MNLNFVLIGWYMNHTMASVCDVCPARYFCVNKNRADPCPAGSFCPENTGFDIEPCPKGTYGPVGMLANASECTQCDGGYYCSEPGSTNMTAECYPGYWCQIGVDTPAPSNNNTGNGGELKKHKVISLPASHVQGICYLKTPC